MNQQVGLAGPGIMQLPDLGGIWPHSPPCATGPFSVGAVAKPPEKSVVIFDIDGTLADCSHRLRLIKAPDTLPYPGWKPNYDQFFQECHKDALISVNAKMLNIMKNDFRIFLVTGRPESVRFKTESWLKTCDIAYERLYMRPDKDHRPDTEVKLEVLTVLRREGLKIELAVEDRSSVVKMWRDNGVACYQVAEGDF